MSNINKQLPSPEEIRKIAQLIFPRRLPSNEGCNESGFIRGANWMREQIKGVVEYTLKQAAEKVTMNLTYPEPYQESNETGLTFANADDISGAGEHGSVEIEKQSILSLKDQIIKELKL